MHFGTIINNWIGSYRGGGARAPMPAYGYASVSLLEHVHVHDYISSQSWDTTNVMEGQRKRDKMTSANFGSPPMFIDVSFTVCVPSQSVMNGFWLCLRAKKKSTSFCRGFEFFCRISINTPKIFCEVIVWPQLHCQRRHSFKKVGWQEAENFRQEVMVLIMSF